MQLVRRTQFQLTTAQLVNRRLAGRRLVAMGVVGAERRGRETFALLADGTAVHTDRLEARVVGPVLSLARLAEAAA
jgi:hypothetical protein